MQQRVLQVHDVDELKQCSIDVWHHFEQSVIDDSVDQWRKCLCAWICVKWRPFEHLTLLTHMLFCVSCLLILWTLSKCYCVKCSRISQISVSYLAQGSAATHLRYDGQCDMDLVANFSENTTVIEFWKSVNICRSYKRMYSSTVFF